MNYDLGVTALNKTVKKSISMKNLLQCASCKYICVFSTMIAVNQQKVFSKDVFSTCTAKLLPF